MNRHGRPARGWRRGAGRSCAGQATVEVALLLPVIVFLALAIGQVALVAHARVLVTHAAREGARLAAVGESDFAVREAVIERSALRRDRILVDVVRGSSTVEVTVRYADPTDVALVGAVIGEVELVAVAVMRRE